MEHWPLFNLHIETPRLTLSYPTDAQLDLLATLAANGIHTTDYMPFSAPWTRQAPPQLQQNLLQYHWMLRAQWKPEAWELPLVAIVEDAVVGTQSLMADAFPVTRVVGTGSWLGREYQGQGLGTEMRAAILHLAFAGLHARVAYTSAYSDNLASLGVTRALGYSSNGSRRVNREGQPALQLHFELSRIAWESRRRTDIKIMGLERCQTLFSIEFP